MKSRILFFLFLTFIFDFSLTAQTKISGNVLDSDQKPIEMALSCILNAKDSTLVKSTLTDEKGVFIFENIDPGSYFFTTTYLGYTSFSSEVYELSSETIEWNFPTTIELKLAAATTGEVTISAIQNFITIKPGMFVMRPDALITNAAATAWEVLQKAPGITVGANDELILRGKQGVVVYQDERPMYLDGADLANALKSIPASAIDVIEIITTPGAKYDAEGNAGIVVIRLKKNKMMGLSGGINLGYGQGFYRRLNGSFNISYRINKFNFFANASNFEYNSYQDLKIKRNYFTNEGVFESDFNQHTWLRRGGNNSNGKIGVDFYATSKITFGLSVGGFINTSFEKSKNESLLTDQFNNPTARVDAYSPLDRTFKNQNINFNFNYDIDTTGKSISINADYLNYNSDSDQSLINILYSPTNEIVSKTNLISSLPSFIDIYSAKADYTHPIKSEWVFETGAKFSNVKTRNQADFQNENNGVLTPNYEFSNDFSYTEGIGAGYLNLTLTKKKYSAQVGLRAENTKITGNQLGNIEKPDSTFKRDFTNVFPTLFLVYNFDTLGSHVLTFNAGRRIDRPNYQDMNPFTYPIDKFTLYSGNPFLVPTFTYSTDLSYTYKNKITTSLVYSFQEDVMTETIKQDSSIFFSRPGNLGKQHTFGVSANAYIQLKNKFTIQCYSELMTNIILSELNGAKLDNRGTYWYIGPTLLWAGNKGWGAEIGGTYITRVASGQFNTISVGTLRAGISKKILKEKGAIKIICDDILHSNLPGGDILGLGASSASWKSKLDTRVVTISLSYRFAKGAALKARNAGGADMEKSRVN